MIKKLTTWQSVIYRNYGVVPVQNIAKVLNTDIQTVQTEAKRLGIDCIEFEDAWLKKGFVTIIRNNFDLLSNEKIQLLLGISAKEYFKLMEEYDFLYVKLGKKPDVVDPSYKPLTKEEELATEIVREFTIKHYVKPKVKRFDFFLGKAKSKFIEPKEYAIEERYTSVYNADYGGGLLDDNLSDFSEEYLSNLSQTGVNGVWIQETLRNISPFELDERYQSADYKIRIKNFKKLTERCEKFGVSVYLYLNEPRSLPKEFFDNYPDMKGDVADNGYCLCTSNKKVQNYLYQAVKFVAKSVPLLKGIMTITMSENDTHCYSRSVIKHVGAKDTKCPVCAKREPEEVAAEVNNIIAKALRDSGERCKLIANLWGWADNMGWTEEQVFRGVDLLDKDVEILCVSEFGKKFNRGGVDLRVIDYSISVVGPSDTTKKVLKYAKQKGHKIWAKMQCNNSWELSAAPYIPAFDLMIEHVKNLKELGVSGLMMGWSLGGYPGGALTICNSFCGKDEIAVEDWYKLTYDEDAPIVQKAVSRFSSAFTEYPFSIDGLYYGGHNLGCGNQWSIENTNRTSTMVCYTFEDYGFWTKPYGVDIYISQYEKLLDKWEEGLSILSTAKSDGAKEIKRMAEVCKCHWGSAMRLARFSLLKKDVKKNAEEIVGCLEKEYDATKKLYELYSEDATVGFEATNHYYYNANTLLEKMISLCEVKQEVEQK